MNNTFITRIGAMTLAAFLATSGVASADSSARKETRSVPAMALILADIPDGSVARKSVRAARAEQDVMTVASVCTGSLTRLATRNGTDACG